uniref:Uncharacterized protein n=1 Tax=Picea sitchensis TaxID=3332 RepID=A9NRA6_PICSI|nr:unknown [Picea sitchensis]
MRVCLYISSLLSPNLNLLSTSLVSHSVQSFSEDGVHCGPH